MRCARHTVCLVPVSVLSLFPWVMCWWLGTNFQESLFPLGYRILALRNKAAFEKRFWAWSLIILKLSTKILCRWNSIQSTLSRRWDMLFDTRYKHFSEFLGLRDLQRLWPMCYAITYPWPNTSYSLFITGALWCLLFYRHLYRISIPWASYQIRKIAGCACAGNAGNVFPRRRFQRKPLVSDPGMHHGTCVTHVPWCMSGSLTCGDGENVPGIPGACAPAILRIWQEAHGMICSYWLFQVWVLSVIMSGYLGQLLQIFIALLIAEGKLPRQDSFTVSLHNSNDRQFACPQSCATGLSVPLEQHWKFSTVASDSIAFQFTKSPPQWDFVDSYSEQKIKRCFCQPISGCISHPTDVPVATRLKLGRILSLDGRHSGKKRWSSFSWKGHIQNLLRIITWCSD